MKKTLVILIISILVVSGVLCAKHFNTTKSMFETNVEVLAEEESASDGFDTMCVVQYDDGNCRYDKCSNCDSWVMCTPREIKYCK